MNIEISTKDIMQIVSLLVLGGGVIWRFSTVLGDIKTELKLIAQKLNDVNPKLEDHEARIRILESKCRSAAD